MAAYTTTLLLAQIARRSFLPTGQSTFTPSDLLSIADEVCMNEIVPEIRAVREEFFIFAVDTAITAGVQAHPIHARAMGLILRDVKTIDGTTIVPDFKRYEPEDITSSAPGEPKGFSLQDNTILLWPPPATTTKSLRQEFTLRRNNLVPVASAAVVSAFNPATKVVSVTTIPASWATGSIFDLIKQDGGHECLSIDLTSTLVSGTAITLPSLPSGLRVGDYIALAGESPVVQLPPEFQPVLAQGVAAQILADMNIPGNEKARERFDKLLANGIKAITPRVEGEERQITPANWFGN